MYKFTFIDYRFVRGHFKKKSYFVSLKREKRGSNPAWSIYAHKQFCYGSPCRHTVSGVVIQIVEPTNENVFF